MIALLVLRNRLQAICVVVEKCAPLTHFPHENQLQYFRARDGVIDFNVLNFTIKGSPGCRSTHRAGQRVMLTRNQRPLWWHVFASKMTDVRLTKQVRRDYERRYGVWHSFPGKAVFLLVRENCLGILAGISALTTTFLRPFLLKLCPYSAHRHGIFNK